MTFLTFIADFHVNGKLVTWSNNSFFLFWKTI